MCKTYVFISWNILLDTLSFSHRLHNLTGLGGGVEGRATRKDLPVIEDGLRECLTASIRPKIGRKAKRLVDRQIRLDVEQWSSWALFFRKDMASSSCEHTIDTSHGLFRHLNLDQVDRFKDTWVSEKSGSVQNAAGRRDDLPTSTMDGISVQGNIHDVEANRSHWLFGNRSFSGSPLKARNDRVFDFVQILDGFSLIDEQVGPCGIRAKTPNLSCISHIPAMIIGQDTSSRFEVVSRSNLAALNVL